jgi:hypothetical protein
MPDTNFKRGVTNSATPKFEAVGKDSIDPGVVVALDWFADEKVRQRRAKRWQKRGPGRAEGIGNIMYLHFWTDSVTLSRDTYAESFGV